MIEGWVRGLERSHREERAALGREQGREQGVLRPRLQGYREARFEKIKRKRKFVAAMYKYRPELDYGETERRRQVAKKSKGELDAMIGALPEGDRKELERRDQEHPPPVFPQQKPTETPEQSRVR